MNKIIAFLSAFCLYAGNSAAQSTPLLPGSEGALGACRADERKQTSELFGMKVAVVQTISPLKNGGCRFETVAESDLGVNITVCNFTAEQIKEIARAENDEEKEIYEETIPLRMTDEDGNPAEGGQLTVRGTRKEIVWSRFLNDENVCRSEFKEKDSAQDLAAAVADCKKFEKNLNLFGFRLNVSVKPGSKGCLYRFRSKTPGMTNGFAGEESRTPPHEIEINCRFSPEQRRQAADFIRSGGSSEYEFPVGRDSKATLQIMLPTEFLHDPQICTVSRRPESRTEPSAAEIKQQKV
ncbi:MAG: hypothetical protein V8R89_02030 [Alphaproteobacteria bacterium]|jgi:hypothetical protein